MLHFKHTCVQNLLMKEGIVLTIVSALKFLDKFRNYWARSLLWGIPLTIAGAGRAQASKKIVGRTEARFQELTTVPLTWYELHRVFSETTSKDVIFIDPVTGFYAHIITNPHHALEESGDKCRLSPDFWLISKKITRSNQIVKFVLHACIAAENSLCCWWSFVIVRFYIQKPNSWEKFEIVNSYIPARQAYTRFGMERTTTITMLVVCGFIASGTFILGLQQIIKITFDLIWLGFGFL